MPKNNLFTHNKKGKFTRFIGVHWKNDDRYMTQIRVNGKVLKYGPYSTELEAAKKYDEVAKKYMGKRKRPLNFKDGKINMENAIRKQKKKVVKKGKYSFYIRNHIKNMNIDLRRSDSKSRTPIPFYLREVIRQEQETKCNMCDKSLHNDRYEVDHIVPWEISKCDDRFNLQILCLNCHKYKSMKIDVEIKKMMMYEPEINLKLIKKALNLQKKIRNKEYGITKNKLKKLEIEDDEEYVKNMDDYEFYDVQEYEKVDNNFGFFSNIFYFLKNLK